MHDEGNDQAVGVPYREAVESLIYLVLGTRPDISFAVSKVSQYLESPKVKYWRMVKRIFCNLNGTSDMGLLYEMSPELKITGFSDADYGGDADFGSGAISWNLKRQSTVALSTTESEYIAASTAVEDLIWLDRLHRNILIGDTNYNFVVGVLVLLFGLVTQTQKKIPSDTRPAVEKRIDCTIMDQMQQL
ncbi:hypothetical protein JTB14_016580 [Gonioctena quinquepunctata]|nr:hypothetical protein JTB14_016580 [Gonioctena quinquepunctata]